MHILSPDFNSSVRQFIKWAGCVLLLPLFLHAADYVTINQAGYLPDHPKQALVTTAADSFHLVDQSSSQIVHRGGLTQRAALDPATGMNVWEADFSAWGVPGTYVISVPGIGKSHAFAISNAAYTNLTKAALKAFYFQRCGMDLSPYDAGVYTHIKCHTQDGNLHSSTGESGAVKSTGGWHDAGDYGKYVVNAGVTVGTLLLAYEQFPERFAVDHLKIKESGNGIPDLLDEVRYELRWLLTMQRADGSVYHKLTRENFEPFIMPQKDTEKRYLMPVSSTATADFAAMMAQAGRIYRTISPAFADSCLVAAEKAWTWLQANPNIVPAGGFKNPTGVSTGEYGDGNDRDERLWAAAELWRTTSDSKYETYYLANYQSQNLFQSEMSWGNVAPLAHLAYLLSPAGTGNATAKQNLNSKLQQFAANLLTQVDGSGFRVLLKPGEYNWGSNSRPLNRAILLILAARSGGSAQFESAALDQLHYVMGRNGLNFCFVTGTNAFSMKNPHHRPSAADGIKDPVPGMLSGGPNQYLQDDLMKRTFTAATPPALCFIDHVDSYASNEICINWNAPLVFVAGYFAADTTTPGIEKKTASPEKYGLLQNYPNPFNASTTIPFSLAQPSRVNLEFFNVQGERIESRALGMRTAGEHTYAWQPAWPSGIYYCRLSVENQTALYAGIKKMVLVR